MSYSRVIYGGDDVTTDFTVTFPYLDIDHVQVYLNDTLQLNPSNYTFSGASTVQFRQAPAIGDAITIVRVTSPTATLVDFVDGSTLRANDLDLAYLHNFYLTQEYRDVWADLINQAFINVATDVGIVETETDEVIAALVAEMLSDAAAATLQDRITDIDANAEAIITLGDALQIQVNTLAQGIAALVFLQAEAPVAGVGGVPDPIPDGSRWYDSDDNNHPYMFDAGLGGWTSIEDPRIGDAYAYITILETNYGAGGTALVNELTGMSTATTNVASELALLGAQNVGATAFILDSSTVKIDTDLGDTLATRFTQITADKDANAAAITSEETARISADGVLASTIALIGAENGTSTAFILDTSTVKIDSDGGDTFATRLSALSVADSDNSASITTIEDVTIPGINSNIDALEAEYGVDLDVNGYVTGFRILNGGTPGASAFVIRADKFAVVDTTGGTLSEYVPFEISGGKINMRSDVQISGNLVVDGTITSTQLTGTQLSDLYTGLGAIVQGTITLNSSGHIKGGATAFETGSGFYLGYDSPDHKFYIGDIDTGNYLSWDGSTMTISGEINAGVYSYLGSTNQFVNFLGVTYSAGTSYVQKKSVTLDKAGSVNFAVTRKHGTLTDFVSWVQYPSYQILKNGSAVTSQNATTTGNISADHVLSGLVIGDVITLEVRAGTYNTSSGTSTASLILSSMYLEADVVISENPTVNEDSA